MLLMGVALCVTMATYGWWMETRGKEEWRYVLDFRGERYVMTPGMNTMPVWFAHNLDTSQQVSSTGTCSFIDGVQMTFSQIDMTNSIK